MLQQYYQHQQQKISYLYTLNSILHFILLSQSYPQENVLVHIVKKDFDQSLDHSIQSFI